MKTPTRRPPAALVGPAGLAVALVVLPIIGLLQRAPWSTLIDRLTDDDVLEALRVSVVVSVVAATVATVLGLPLAWILARHDGRFARMVHAAVLVPMVLPPVVGGTALLFALGRRGLFEQWLDEWFGITLPFTTAGAVVAASFVALPFFVTTVEAALRQAGTELEEAAAVNGATPLTAFLTVTVPASPRRHRQGLPLPGPVHWASSAPPSPLLATSPVRPGPCRWKSFSRSRLILSRPWRSVSCCSGSASLSSSPCVEGGSAVTDDWLRINGRIVRGGLNLTVDLDLPQGVIAVVGPNGVGKTSLLRAIAGLDPLAEGEIVRGQRARPSR